MHSKRDMRGKTIKTKDLKTVFARENVNAVLVVF